MGSIYKLHGSTGLDFLLVKKYDKQENKKQNIKNVTSYREESDISYPKTSRAFKVLIHSRGLSQIEDSVKIANDVSSVGNNIGMNVRVCSLSTAVANLST